MAIWLWKDFTLTLIFLCICVYILYIKNRVNEKLLVAALPLKLKVVECDGGSKDANTTAVNVLWSQDSSIGTLLSLLLNS